MKNLFISHSSKNAVIAHHFINFLEQIGLKRNNIFCSSSISQGAKNGEDLNVSIGKAIKKSNLIFYLISRDFMKSSYCIEELGVGWYLSQECNKKCFYIILPDVQLSDVVGFVNDKVQKFTIINPLQIDSLISLSEDIFDIMNIKTKRTSTFIEYINCFFNANNSELNILMQNKEREENEIKEYDNQLFNLQQSLKDKDKTIQLYKQNINENSENIKTKLLVNELETIQKNFFILGSPEGLTESQYKCLTKSFWFGMINRYEKLIETLKITKRNHNMEILIASIYAIEDNYDKSYEHYIEYVKCCNSVIYYSYFKFFLNKFKKSMKEIIEILQQKIVNTEEGIIKDSLKETVKLLLKREKELGYNI